jgi:hypothetical protein
LFDRSGDVLGGEESGTGGRGMTGRPQSEPLAIAYDTNEVKDPWVLIKMAGRGEITLIKATLNVGDFTVVGHAKRCCIETKWSIADLAASFTARRDNFEAMWTRAWEHEMKVLIIVGCWHDLEHENYRAGFEKNSFVQTLIQWSIKFNFQYVFVPDVAEGQHRVYLYCLAYQRMVDRGTIGKAPQPVRYLIDSARWAKKLEPGMYDETVRKVERNGEIVQVSPAREFQDAMLQLGVAAEALTGRRGTK